MRNVIVIIILQMTYDDAHPMQGFPSYNENSYIAQIPNSRTQKSVLDRENIVMTTPRLAFNLLEIKIQLPHGKIVKLRLQIMA